MRLLSVSGLFAKKTIFRAHNLERITFCSSYVLFSCICVRDGLAYLIFIESLRLRFRYFFVPAPHAVASGTKQ